MELNSRQIDNQLLQQLDKKIQYVQGFHQSYQASLSEFSNNQN